MNNGTSGWGFLLVLLLLLGVFGGGALWVNYNTVATDLKDSQAQATQAANSLSQCETARDQAQAGLNATSQDNQNLQNANQGLQNTIAADEKQIQDLQAAAEKVRQDGQAQAASKDAKIQQLVSDKAALEGQLDQVLKANQQQAASIQQLEKDKAALEEQVRQNIPRIMILGGPKVNQVPVQPEAKKVESFPPDKKGPLASGVQVATASGDDPQPALTPRILIWLLFAAWIAILLILVFAYRRAARNNKVFHWKAESRQAGKAARR